MCAGQGRDVVDALKVHPRGLDVTARLVESDPEIAEQARSRASSAGLSSLDVRVGDAGLADSYRGAVPADVLVVCGVFGNLTPEDITRTISMLPSLSAPGAHVIWTRHRRPPDLTGAIRDTFGRRGFVEVDFVAPEPWLFTVGTHRLLRRPDPFNAGARLFTFVGDGFRPA